MAITQNTFTGNGSNLGPFTFTFQWLESNDINVTVDGVLKVAGTHYNLQNLNYATRTGGEVLFIAGNAPPNNATIRVYRTTGDTNLAATFYSGSAIRSQDLNDNFLQNLYIAQETNNNVAGAVAGQIPDDTITTAKIVDQAVTAAKIADGVTSSKFSFLQSGTGATSRTVENKLRDVVSVKDFGAVGDGVTDNTLAFQLAFNYVNSIGGGSVYIPTGRYRKADTAGNTWTIYSNTTLFGDGDASVIFFDDKSSVARSGNDMLICSNTQNITFRDFKVEGTALTELTATNQKQLFTGDVINGLRMHNVTIRAVRYMALAFNNAKNVVFTNNRLEYVVTDGLRCTNSSNIVISNNTLSNVTDDAIAVHSVDSATVPNSGVIITNNVLEACQGIKVLGAKCVNISGNVLRRTLRNPIDVQIVGSGSEGNSPQFSINISNNIISDTFGDRGVNNAIFVSTGLGRDYGALSTKPGITAQPYPYNYLNNIDAGTPIRAGEYGVTIENNQILRTLPSGVTYDAWGYGQLFDRTTAGFFSNPSITEATFNIHGIIINGPVNGLAIRNNYIANTGVGFTGIIMAVTTATNTLDYENTVISGNILYDTPGIGIDFPSVGSGVGACSAWVHSNIFDVDPFFRLPSHNVDNTWTDLNTTALRSLSSTSIIARNNVFKNCSLPWSLSPVLLNSSDNIIYADYVGPSDNAGNKGVRLIPFASDNLIVPIVGDPTLATFGNISSIPVMQSAAMPTTGKYVVGHIVGNAAPAVLGTAGSRYTIVGWRRLTTGTAHVLNTDWVEIRAATGT